MPVLKIDESLIHQNATDKSFQRGKEYARSQAVSDLILRGQTLQASVAGNEYYRVTIGFNDQKVQSATCSCPYDFGDWCKHIVATLLVGMEQDKIEERPSLVQLLEHLDLEQTRKLLHELVLQSPDLIDPIDLYVELLIASKNATSNLTKSTGSKTVSQHPEIDRTPFRKQVRSQLREALRDIEDSYSEEDPFAGVLDEEIEKALKFLESGDSFRAFVKLYAIAEELSTSEYVDDIEEYGGDLSEVVYELDRAIAEAILWTDFSVEEREKWIAELEGTQDSLGTELELSLAALIQGWDDPYLQSALHGEFDRNLTLDEIDKLGNDLQKLGYLRLNILAAQERFDEYLNFAKAANFFTSYVNMLIRVGRVNEAIATAENVQNEDDAFEIAKALLEHGFENEALYIANKGLQLQEEDAKRNRSLDFAVWTALLAERLEETGIFLNAKIIVFKLKPSIADYHKIRDLTKDKWTSVKAILLKYLAAIDFYGTSEAKIDIFLEEELFEQAIAIADASYCHTHLRLRVMKAVINIQPQWVISKAKVLAEDIIVRGKSESYDEAIAWIEQVRNGYLALKQGKEWLSYRNELVEVNARKRKLMELFKRKGL
jgi:uncharacterized Zn finger protein